MQRRLRDALWALGLCAAVAAVLAVLGTTAWALLPAACVVAALAGRRLSSLRPALTAFAVALGAGLAGFLIWRPGDFLSDWLTGLLLTFAFVVLPWWLGRYRRLRIEQAERERLIVADHARLRERARIATEMHDSLGHELALIALRGGALELAPDLSEARRGAVAELRASAVAATDRLHEIIGVLRDESDGTRATHAGYADEDIDDLVQRSRRSGADVELRTVASGPGAPPWSVTARQAVHRVVQEAITNATKYAPGARITVRIDERSEPLVVEVGNGRSEGPHPDRPMAGGRGLAGLDARLRLIGGTLEALPRDGGFFVRARLSRQAVAGSPGPEEPVRQVLGRARRLGRKRARQAAILPVLLVLVLASALVAVQVVTVRQTALPPDDYARLSLGQTRDQVAHLLPPRGQPSPPPILDVPAAPAGARCEFYQARAQVFDFGPNMFRLCFLDGALVSKDLLTPKTT